MAGIIGSGGCTPTDGLQCLHHCRISESAWMPLRTVSGLCQLSVPGHWCRPRAWKLISDQREGRDGGRKEEGKRKQRWGRGLGRPSTGVWDLLSCPWTHPSLLGSHLYLSPMGAPCLLKLSSPLVQIHFSTRQTRAGPAFPFNLTGWLSAAVASALVRKIKKEARGFQSYQQR